VGAIGGPFGAALVAAGSTSRIVYSLSLARLLPALFSKVTSRYVPLNALILNFMIGLVIVFFFSFREAVAINSATILLSFSAGPITLLTFRKQFPDKERLFKLPFVHFFAIVGFGLASLVIYWSGYKTFLFMLATLGLGSIIFMINTSIHKEKHHELDLSSAFWILPYMSGIGIISYTGNFGGQGILSEAMENILVVILSIGILYLAVHLSLTREKSNSYYDVRTGDETGSKQDIKSMEISQNR
jgi:amino acid transporter